MQFERGKRDRFNLVNMVTRSYRFNNEQLNQPNIVFLAKEIEVLLR